MSNFAQKRGKMSTYYVIRNNRHFGPYAGIVLADMVSRGKVLTCDMAQVDGEPYDGRMTVGDCLRREGLKAKVRSHGTLSRQLSSIGSEILFPKGDLSRSVWKEDTRLIMMAAVGLLPIIVELVGNSSLLTFYLISLYFSGIWGLFFWYLFKTRQVTVKAAVTTFFLTQGFVFLAWDLLGIVALNPFYWFENLEGIVFQLIFYIGGVGFTEELAKAIPLFIIIARARQPLIPQTMVFYGLISGVAFGVFEGVQYQMTVNSELEYSESFYANITRLTTLPFAHALWAAIAGYFISFSQLYPAYKWALRVLAIAIPAILHGVYDVACNYDILSLPLRAVIIFFSALLLVTYLKRGKDFQTHLSDLTNDN